MRKLTWLSWIGPPVALRPEYSGPCISVAILSHYFCNLLECRLGHSHAHTISILEWYQQGGYLWHQKAPPPLNVSRVLSRLIGCKIWREVLSFNLDSFCLPFLGDLSLRIRSCFWASVKDADPLFFLKGISLAISLNIETGKTRMISGS